MKNDSPDHILYIEPGPHTSEDPVVDDLTRKMTAAFRAAKSDEMYWRGCHECRCGVHSSNCDYILPDGHKTNSLCIHYLAFHREDVPTMELVKVVQLTSGEEEPGPEETARPAKRRITRYEQLTGRM